MSISDFFENRLGVKLKNLRWSWGASDPDTKQVFLRVWDDQIEFHQGVEHIQILNADWDTLVAHMVFQNRNSTLKNYERVQKVTVSSARLGMLMFPALAASRNSTTKCCSSSE